jgi:1-aminocyclopropane-1-carboxylate deaminase
MAVIKTRKLEYLVADALAKGCGTLVSIGGVQSNHTRQVAGAAARAGLGCVLIQESWVNWPDSVYGKVGNILISRLAGADVRLVRAEFGIGFKQSWERALREIEDSGGRPYAIPAGASDHPLGGRPDAETGEPRTLAGAGRAVVSCWPAWPAAVPVMSGSGAAGGGRGGPRGDAAGARVIAAPLIPRPPGPAVWPGGLCQAPASQPGTRPDGGHEHGGS